MNNSSPTDNDFWKWTAMIGEPEWITAEMVEDPRAASAKKKDLPALTQVCYETLEEGQAAQCLHIGPYADEPPTITALHEFIADNGCDRRGKHHEIYLNNIRHTKPANLRTIIRQPIASRYALQSA